MAQAPTLSPTNAGCDGTMTLSGPPAPFDKFDVFLKVDKGEMKLVANDPRGGFGSAGPTPRQPTVSPAPPSFGVKTSDSSCNDATMGGCHLLQITAPSARLVGKANFDGSGKFTWEGTLATSNSTTTSLITGTGAYAVTGNCLALVHVGVPATTPVPQDYVALIARGGGGGGGGNGGNGMDGISASKVGGAGGPVAIISIR
jgi:hypothetical protein